MLASLTAVGSVAGCLLTSSFDGLTGGTVLPDGGTGGVAAGSSSVGSATTTSSSAAATTSGTGGAASSSSSSSSSATASSSNSSSSSGSTGGDSGAPFPSTPVLDNFNRPDGALGGQWLVQTADVYAIASDQLSVPANADPGTIMWPATFGATQEAFITIVTIASSNFEFELLLKNQFGVSECESIEVTYHYPSIQLYSCSGGNSTQLGNTVNEALGPGDQLGARAYPDGRVEVFKNGTLVGTWDASSFPSYASGGRIGFETDGITTAVNFDDFGGG